jgi:hypothetical protein
VVCRSWKKSNDGKKVVPESGKTDVVDNDNEDVYKFVEHCCASSADKATNVRATLEALFGKASAKELLSCTRSAVAKGSAGHKHRILCIGNKPIRLIPQPDDQSEQS